MNPDMMSLFTLDISTDITQDKKTWLYIVVFFFFGGGGLHLGVKHCPYVNVSVNIFNIYLV